LPGPGWGLDPATAFPAPLLFFPFAAWLLYLLDTSLASEQGYNHVRSYLSFAEVGLIVFIWAFAHHFCAGIPLPSPRSQQGHRAAWARATSYMVLAAGILLTLSSRGRIW